VPHGSTPTVPGGLNGLIADGHVPGSPSVLALLYADHFGHLRNATPT